MYQELNNKREPLYPGGGIAEGSAPPLPAETYPAAAAQIPQYIETVDIAVALPVSTAVFASVADSVPVAHPTPTNNGQLYTPPCRTPAEVIADLAANNDAKEFKTCKYFKQGWNFFKLNAWVMVCATVLWGIILTLLSGVIYWGFEEAGYGIAKAVCKKHEEWDQEKQEHILRISRISMLTIGLMFMQILLFTPVLAIFIKATFKAMRTNAKLNTGDFFSGMSCKYYWSLTGLSSWTILIEILLYSLFILPGIWYQIVTAFSIPVHQQFPGVGAFKSIEISKRATRNHWCSLFGFHLLSFLVMSLGVMSYIGWIIAFPVTIAAYCYCYHHLVGINEFPQSQSVMIHL